MGITNRIGVRKETKNVKRKKSGGGYPIAENNVTNGVLESYKASKAGGDIPANTFVEKMKQVQGGTAGMYTASRDEIFELIKMKKGRKEFFSFSDGKFCVVYSDENYNVFAEVMRVDRESGVVRIAKTQLDDEEYMFYWDFSSFALTNDKFILIYRTWDSSREGIETAKAQLFTITGSSISAGNTIVINESRTNAQGRNTDELRYQAVSLGFDAENPDYKGFALLEQVKKKTLDEFGIETGHSYEYSAYSFSALNDEIKQISKISLISEIEEDRGWKIHQEYGPETKHSDQFALLATEGKLHVFYLGTNSSFELYNTKYHYYHDLTNPKIISLIDTFCAMFGNHAMVMYYAVDSDRNYNVVLQNFYLEANSNQNNPEIFDDEKLTFRYGMGLNRFNLKPLVYIQSAVEDNVVLLNKDTVCINALAMTMWKEWSFVNGEEFKSLIDYKVDDFISATEDQILPIRMTKYNPGYFTLLYIGGINGDNSNCMLKAAIITKGKSETVVKKSETKIDGITKDEIKTNAKGDVWLLAPPTE